MTRIYNFIIVLTVLNLAGAAGLWWALGTMQEKKDEETGIRRQLVEESQKAKKLTMLKKTLVLADKEHEKLYPFLFDQSAESQIKFVSQMEALGTSTTGALVDTKSLTLSDTDPKKFTGEFAISGTWPELYQLLRLTEEFPSRIVISRFDIHEDQNDTSVGARWMGSLGIELRSLRKSK